MPPWELSASSTPADSVLTDEGSVTVVVETEVIDGSGAAAVLLPSSAVAGLEEALPAASPSSYFAYLRRLLSAGKRVEN